ERQHAAFIFFGGGREFRSAVVQILGITPAAIAAPADDGRTQTLPKFRAHVQETGAIRCQEPFVRVYREHVRFYRGDIESQRAETLSPIKVKQYAAAPQFG